jgi:predicted MPP superfamily phosphohydrolase
MSKVLAIGDIHTKTWIIEKVSKVIGDYDSIVFCGDYADNFDASPQDTIKTWRTLKDLQTKHQNKVNLVLGNHDYIYVYDTPSLQSGYNPITHVLIDAPENNNLSEWLMNLPIVIEIDGVTYSHAGITNEWSGTQNVKGLWNDVSPIWARPNKGISYKAITQVFGHTPINTCKEIQEHVWCIDTFSTMHYGSHIGDNSALEVIDGKKFSKTYLKS